MYFYDIVSNMFEAFVPEKEIKKIEPIETDSVVHEKNTEPKESFVGQEHEGIRVGDVQQLKTSDSTKEVFLLYIDVTKDKYDRDENKEEKIRELIKKIGLTPSSGATLNDVKKHNNTSRQYIMVVDHDDYVEGSNKGHPTINPHKPDGGFLEGKLAQYSEYMYLAERKKKTATVEDFLAAQKRVTEEKQKEDEVVIEEQK